MKHTKKRTWPLSLLGGVNNAKLTNNQTHIRYRNLGISRAPLKSQAHQGNRLLTSAATNQKGSPMGSPWYTLRSDFQRVRGDRASVKVVVLSLQLVPRQPDIRKW